MQRLQEILTPEAEQGIHPRATKDRGKPEEQGTIIWEWTVSGERETNQVEATTSEL